MTQQTRSTNKEKFEQGDRPQGGDYADLIDSYLSLADTTAQTITSDVIAPTFIATTKVSAVEIHATAAVIRGTVSAQSIFANAITASAATYQRVCAASARADEIIAGVVSVSALNMQGTLTWTAGLTAAVASTGNAALPTSAVGYLTMQVSGQTVGIPYFKVA